MKWPGPIEGGITQSLIGRVLQDPYQAYIYYGLGKEQSAPLEPNLIWGSGAHVGLEHLIPFPRQIPEMTQEDWEHIQDVVTDYMEKEFPGSPPTYPLSITNMLKLYNDEYKIGKTFETEIKFSRKHVTSTGNIVTLRGKVDGIHEGTLVEHKCKGFIDASQTRAEIPYDLQVLMYCYVTGCNKVIYDLIRIPDTMTYLPPRKNLQRPSSYINSLYYDKQWGDFPISTKKHLWIQQIQECISDEHIDNMLHMMMNPLFDYICMWYERVSDPNFDFQNPSHYNHLFYRKPIRHFDPMLTVKYKGPYWDLITGSIDLDDLQDVESFYKELDVE